MLAVRGRQADHRARLVQFRIAGVRRLGSLMSGSSASNQVLRFDFARALSPAHAVRWCRCRRRRRNFRSTRGSRRWSGCRWACRGGHVDGVLRARPRCDGDLMAFLVRIPRPDNSASPHRQFRCQRRCAALWRTYGAGGKFSLVAGLGIRIRRIALKSVAPGAVVDGPSIFDADLGDEIDNMEGIDAYLTPKATPC